MILIRFVVHSDDREIGTARLVDGRLTADNESAQAIIDGKTLALDMTGPQAAAYFASWSNGCVGSSLLAGPDGDGSIDELAALPTTTAGIDLASTPLGTAIVVVEWTGSGARARLVSNSADRSDDTATILSTLADHDRVGVDCPFGWPQSFVDAITAHRERDPWPTGPTVDDRRNLRLRATDQHVAGRHGISPLSVSSDKIGSVAMRWASLLGQHERSHTPVDRAGTGPSSRSTRPSRCASGRSPPNRRTCRSIRRRTRSASRHVGSSCG